MDRDAILQQFDQIENKVEELIHRCQTLEASNNEMRSKIEQLDAELRERIATQNSYDEEKSLIRSKIDSLLAKLEHMSEEQLR